MWPQLLDLSREECLKLLRRHELIAYSNLVTAFRAQGKLDTAKKKTLKDVASYLKISQERHRAEIRRAVNDEKLSTIAHCLTGEDSSDVWNIEGRRLVPLIVRAPPQTVYTLVADEEANRASAENDKKPLPVQTERKRPLQTTLPDSNKNVQFRMPQETSPKQLTQVNNEEVASKKRKTNVNVESSSLAQHLMMGQPKVSKLQQIYRQKSKPIPKSQAAKVRQSFVLPAQQSVNVHKPAKKYEEDTTLANVDEEPATVTKQEHISVPIVTLPPTSESTVTVKGLMVNTLKPIHLAPTVVQQQYQQQQQQSSDKVTTSDILQKSIKICPGRKITFVTSAPKTTQPQKVIIVSSAPGTSTSSILQRTLTIPFVKTISMKNLEKVKVINSLKNMQTTSPTDTTTSTVGPTTVTTTTTQAVPKPKMITVQTKGKTINKHLNIPFIQSVQLQALHNKGAIKVVPLSEATTIQTKNNTINTTSGPVYIMSSALPKLSVTPAVKVTTADYISTVKPETNSTTNKDEIKGEKVIYMTKPKTDNKGCMLAEILKPSPLLPSEDAEQADIESQITRLTQIPNTNTPSESTDKGTQDSVQEHPEIKNEQDEQKIEEPSHSVSKECTRYVILQDNEATQSVILKKDEQEIVEFMGNLDPETGMYSFKTEDYDLIRESNDVNMGTQSYIIDMNSLQNNELDMPSLS